MSVLRENLKQLLGFFSYREIVFELNRVTEELHNHYSQNYNDMLNSYSVSVQDDNCVNLNNIMEEGGLDTESIMMPDGVTHFEFQVPSAPVETVSRPITPQEVEAMALAAVEEEEKKTKKMDIILPVSKKRKSEEHVETVKVEKEVPKKTIKKKVNSKRNKATPG